MATLCAVCFPLWLAQVEAKFGNQIAAPFPSHGFPLWLVQVEANLVAGHVAESNESDHRGKLGGVLQCGIDVAIWWPDVASNYRVDGVSENAKPSYSTLRNDEQD